MPKGKPTKPKAAPKTAKKKAGRPNYKIDYETLNRIIGYFCTGAECAGILGVSYSALDRALIRDGHGGFVEYFEKVSSHTKEAIRRTQLKVGLKKEDVNMLKHLGNQYLGQAEKSESKQEIVIELVQFEDPRKNS